MHFREFELSPTLLEGIEAIGYKETTPIQEKAIPVILNNKDLIGCAQTGTGKTAAYLLPIIHKIMQSNDEDSVKALVIVPTRELAIQIDQQMEGFSYFTSVSSIAVYGGNEGSAFTNEKRALTQGADVIVGTPGRLLAHLKLGYVKLQGLEQLVLDEADRMLDMGFHDDIMQIISYLPKERQTLLFSATMPKKIRDLTKKILNNPEEINIATSQPAENVSQEAFIVYENQKLSLAEELLRQHNPGSAFIFCGTKKSVKELNKQLKKAGFLSEEIHSDLDQKERQNVLTSFKNGKLNILVATDILSRGIDVEDIELVINYDVPGDPEDYIHRIGRTARAASRGTSLTLVNQDDQHRFNRIEKFLKKEVPHAKLPETFEEGPSYNPGAKPKGGKPPHKKTGGKRDNFKGNQRKQHSGESYRHKPRKNPKESDSDS